MKQSEQTSAGDKFSVSDPLDSEFGSRTAEKMTLDNFSLSRYSSEEACFPVIEACLFAAGHPLPYDKLGAVLGISGDECRELVEKMKIFYNSPDPYPRGVVLITFPTSCQICTKERYGEAIKQALGIRRGGMMSQSLLEVLSVIAYNQPATRAFVDAVRGVDSSYAVTSLLEKNMIEQCGKLDAPGRPSLYRTTEDFLRVFGLSSLSDLPAVRVKNGNGEEIELTAGAMEREGEPS